MWAGPRLGRVCEGERRGIDDAVVAHQRDGNLDGLANPAPPLTERRDIGNHAEDALAAPTHTHKDTQILRHTDSRGVCDVYAGTDSPVHGVGFHVTEPHPEVRSKVLSRQLQHGHVTATVQLHTHIKTLSSDVSV